MPFPGRRQGQRRGAVTQYPTTPIVAYVTITSVTPPSLGPGDTFQITVEVRSPLMPDEAAGMASVVLTDRTVVWATSDAGVATVSGSGLVTYVGAGSCTVTATCEGVAAAQPITCVTPQAAVSTVVVSPSTVQVPVGGTTVLSASPRDSGGNVLLGRTVTWQTDDVDVATVGADSGDDAHTVTVTGVGAGSCTVTATCETVPEGRTVAVIAAGAESSLTLDMAPLYTLPSGLVYNATTKQIDGTVYDTTYAEPTTTVTTVTDQGSRAANRALLQSTIDAATLDTTIVLTAGVDYGNITLKNKASGSGWIYIVSSARGSLSEGTRVTSADAANMPKLRIAQVLGKAVDMAAGAHHYRLVGLDIGKDTGVLINNLIYLSLDSGMGNFANHATDIVIDRCWIHVEETSNTLIAVRGDVTRFAMLDSTIEGFLYPGAETKAFLCVNSEGPQKFINNTMEAASINIMWGGGDPAISNMLPRDIEVRRCHFPKKLAWNPHHSSYAGRAAACKNNFEIKMGERFLVEACVFENCWPEAQNGYSIVLKAVNQNGSATWVTTQDVTFRGCLLKNVYGGFSMAGKPEAQPVALKFGRCDIHHTVVDIADPSEVYNLGSSNTHVAWFFSNTGPMGLRRNTVSPRVAPSRAIFFSGATDSDDVAFTDNITHYGGGTQPGIRGDGSQSPASPNDGAAVLTAYCTAHTFEGNGLWLAGTVATANRGEYEPDNVLAASTSLDAVVPDRLTGDYTPALAAFNTASTTGDMPGADWSAVDTGLSGVV